MTDYTTRNRPLMSVDDIEAAIRTMVVDRGLEPGDRIGAERELATRLGVTRWSIRLGLEKLEANNEILRTHGRNGGVFVAPKRLIRSTPVVGLPQYLRAQGVESGSTVLGTRAAPGDEEAVKQLGLEADAWIFYVDRLRLADGLPLVLETARFPCGLFPGLLELPLGGSLYEVIETQYGVHKGAALETITAVAATREVSEILQVSVGAPLLSIVRTTELEDGRPFEYSHELYRADRTTITHRSDGDRYGPRTTIAT